MISFIQLLVIKLVEIQAFFFVGANHKAKKVIVGVNEVDKKVLKGVNRDESVL